MILVQKVSFFIQFFNHGFIDMDFVSNFLEPDTRSIIY